jgi:hypothetical protein
LLGSTAIGGSDFKKATVGKPGYYRSGDSNRHRTNL